MKRYRWTGGVSVLLLAALLCGGCADKQEQIAMLESEREALREELNRINADKARLLGDLNGCQQGLADARGEASGLRDQLAAVPEQSVPEGWTAVPGGAMIAIEGWALFDSGKPTIQDGSKRILDLIVSTVQNEYANKEVLVFGHTDNIPIKHSGWKDNWELSNQRALSVVRYFASRGVDASRLAACGCGEHRPRVANDSKRNMQKNRRVEIFVLDPQPRTGTS
ncbi:MAG: OmpA family protein [bacterium]|nr:OmpA family protein [bacterium]